MQTAKYNPLKEWIKKIPLLSSLLRWGWGYMKLPGRIVLIVNALNDLKSNLAQLKFQVKGQENGGLYKTTWDNFYANVEVTEEFIELNVQNHRYFVELVQEFARENAGTDRLPRLMEFGIGTASMTIWFSRQQAEVFGLDNDPLIITRGVQTQQILGGDAKFICVDGFDMDRLFKKQLFDAVFSQGTMEHFDDETIALLLKKQLKVSKSVIFSVPSIHYPQKDRGDERLMNVDQWKSILEQGGLAPRQIAYYSNDQHIAVALSHAP